MEIEKNLDKDAMLHCILSEPDLIKELYEDKENITKDFVKLFSANNIKKIYFSGQASGIFVGNMLKPIFEDLLDIEVTVTNPAVFNEYEKFNVNNAYKANEIVMLCPAHSGTTNGPILMARKCKDLGIFVVSTTWDITSPLAQLSDVVIDKKSGKEISFIETKGHIASMVCFFLCAIETAYKLNKINIDKYQYFNSVFEKLPSTCKQICKDTIDWYANNKQLILNKDKARYIGFNTSGYALCKEGSLKIAEATSISALCYEMEEFMHTSTTQIVNDSLVFVIAPNLKGISRMRDLICWLKDHTNETVILANANEDYVDEKALTSCFIDVEYLYVLEYLIPFQIIAHLAAMDMGLSTITPQNKGASKALKTHIC